MVEWKEHKLVNLFLLKGKYATASLVATLIEYGLYSLFVYIFLFGKTKAHISSFAIAMVSNFLLQRFFVFKLNRPVFKVFAMAMTVSLGGLLLSSFMFSSLMKVAFFVKNHYLAKLLASGTTFLYNFYLKRFAFEKKFV
jgi:putative flippase GtrA